MESLKVLGLACVDQTFRNQLFGEGIDKLQGFQLSHVEREGLNRIVRSAAVRSAFQQVDAAIRGTCPSPPCDHPRCVTLNPYPEQLEP